MSFNVRCSEEEEGRRQRTERKKVKDDVNNNTDFAMNSAGSSGIDRTSSEESNYCITPTGTEITRTEEERGER